MGRMYTVSFENGAILAADGDLDIFELTCADDKPITVHALFLGQSTELGDAAEEQLRIAVIRGHTTSGSGGGTATPRPLQVSDAAAAFTCEVRNDVIASVGTPIDLHVDTYNLRVGYPLVLTPEMRWHASQASLLVVRLMAAVTDDLNMSATMYVEEHG